MDNNKKKETLKLALEKVSLTDAGRKSIGLDYPMQSKSSKNKVFYPSLYLNTKEAPDLAGKEVGDEFTMVIKACIKSHSLSENSDNKNEDFSIELRKIGIIK